MTVEFSSDTSSSSIFCSSGFVGDVNVCFDDFKERSNGVSSSLLCVGDVVNNKRETILDGLGNCLN
jgi:hypothetical protein